MGLVPLLMPRNAAQALAYCGERWQHEMRGRRSRFGWRRRRAYSACCALIRAREAVLGMRPDPWAPAPTQDVPAPPPPDIEQSKHNPCLVLPTHHNTGKRAL